MELDIRAQNVDVSPALRLHCERRIGFAIGRFRERLGRVTVTLNDINGPRGGDDLVCQVVVEIAGRRGVVVRARASDAYAAVDLAAGKASVAVARALARSRPARAVVAEQPRTEL